MTTKSLSYQKKMLNPFLFKLGMFYQLPSVFFWGIRMIKLDENECELSVPFSWRTQNPFKSIYFAALAGAAELSTGALCQLHLAGRPSHSMLVVDFKMNYLKKGCTKIIFSCTQGLTIKSVLDGLKASGDSETITLKSDGRNDMGELVCIAEITWSFKKK